MLNPKKKNVSSLAIGMSHLDFIFYDDHAWYRNPILNSPKIKMNKQLGWQKQAEEGSTCINMS